MIIIIIMIIHRHTSIMIIIVMIIIIVRILIITIIVILQIWILILILLILIWTSTTNKPNYKMGAATRVPGLRVQRVQDYCVYTLSLSIYLSISLYTYIYIYIYTHLRVPGLRVQRVQRLLARQRPHGPGISASFRQSYTRKGISRQGIGSCRKEFLCVNTTPCRHMPLLVHFWV